MEFDYILYEKYTKNIFLLLRQVFKLYSKKAIRFQRIILSLYHWLNRQYASILKKLSLKINDKKCGGGVCHNNFVIPQFFKEVRVIAPAPSEVVSMKQTLQTLTEHLVDSGAGTAYPSGAPEFTLVCSGVCVAEHLVFYVFVLFSNQ